MLSPFYKFVVTLTLILPLIFFGCKKETKPDQLTKPESKSTVPVKDISGEYFGFLKNVLLKEGSYVASIVFVEHQLKHNGNEQNSNIKFADSLEVLELPNEYFISVKGKNSEQFVIDTSANVVMQTASRNASGNYKFNENITCNKLNMLYGSNEGKRFSQIPFRFKISHNIIQSIEEKYIP